MSETDRAVSNWDGILFQLLQMTNDDIIWFISETVDNITKEHQEAYVSDISPVMHKQRLLYQHLIILYGMIQFVVPKYF